MILSAEELAKRMAARPAPHISERNLEDEVATVDFHYHNLLTICIITTKAGFYLTGESCAVSPENHDRDIGETYAYKAALNKLWPLEGYRLKHELLRNVAA